VTFVDTGEAIGAITSLLQARLSQSVNSLGLDVTVGRPEPSAAGNGSNKRLNLFLYEIHFDEHLKNVSLDDGQQPPLWLVLRYLLTAFDESGDSDTADAHKYLGAGIRSLQGLNFLSMRGSGDPALVDNPENLKITFNEASHDLLGRIMQGSEEKYRLSVGFEVRPVMIANPEPPSYSLLVGIDNTSNPPTIIGKDGIELQVLPSMGPTITSISPTKFESNSTITIFGSNINLPNLSVVMDSTKLKIKYQTADKIECLIDGNLISPGSKPIHVVQNLPNGIQRSSNILVGNLLPTLTGVVVVPGSVAKVNDPKTNQTKLAAKIDLSGTNLGQKNDDICIALYQNGTTVKFLTSYSVITPQTKIEFTIDQTDPILPGKYRVILIVNGQQAKNSPQVELVTP
jgi:hypothetical protein